MLSARLFTASRASTSLARRSPLIPRAASIASEAFLSASTRSSSYVGPAGSLGADALASDGAASDATASAAASDVPSVASEDAASPAASSSAAAAASGASLPGSPAAAASTAAVAVSLASPSADADSVAGALSAAALPSAVVASALPSTARVSASAVSPEAVSGGALEAEVSSAEAGLAARGFDAGRAGKKPLRIWAASRMTRPENSVIVFIFCCLSAETGLGRPRSTKQQGRSRQPNCRPVYVGWGTPSHPRGPRALRGPRR